MAVDFRILPHRGLVYVRYSRRMVIDESDAAIRAYRRHRDFTAGQNQLIDLADVSDWERDFPRLLSLQARMADAFFDPANPVRVVGYAPSEVALRVADIYSRSWDDIHGITYLVAETEADSLELLGCPETRIADLLATV